MIYKYGYFRFEYLLNGKLKSEQHSFTPNTESAVMEYAKEDYKNKKGIGEIRRCVTDGKGRWSQEFIEKGVE